MRDVQFVVHPAQVGDQQRDLLVVVPAAQMHVIGDHAVALLGRLVLRVEGDDLRQIHRVGRAVDDVRAVIGERRAGLVRHGVHDAQQRVGERHAGQALRVVHAVAGSHVAVVARHEILHNHLDGVNRQRIGEVAVRGGDIRLDGVGHRVHAGVRNQLLGHGLRQLRIDDGHVRRDFKIGNRVFDALGIIGDDGERRHLGRRAGGGGNGAEMCFAAQLRQAEDLAHVLKRALRVFVFDPHGLRRVDRGAAAHGDNPIRLEPGHRGRALHHGLHGRVRLDALVKLDLHARFLQILLGLVEEAEALHRAAADANHRALAFKGFERFQCSLAVIQIAGKSETSHPLFLLFSPGCALGRFLTSPIDLKTSARRFFVNLCAYYTPDV